MMKPLMVLVAVIALTGVANADDATKAQMQPKLAQALCYAGRVGRPLEDVAKQVGVDDPKDLPTVFKNVWEGCRQEAIKDFSCYPYTIIKEGNRRVFYMPGTAPSNALYEPLTADCRGRVGRWPAWPDAKETEEDLAETERMGVFYANNPPGELPKPPSR
jgi:hypothetical protein